MKLILLPGMDGTGNLFSELLSYLPDFENSVIELPATGSQDYDSLTRYVRNGLPDSPFVLLAESFSGPIGARLARLNMCNMKGIIFVATFNSTPKRMLLEFSKFLPISLLLKTPLPNWIYRRFFLGNGADEKLLKSFKDILKELTAPLIRDRFTTLRQMERGRGARVPALYIQAKQDVLVDASKADEFRESFPNLRVVSLTGPHFILQADPLKCSKLIIDFIRGC